MIMRLTMGQLHVLNDSLRLHFMLPVMFVIKIGSQSWQTQNFSRNIPVQNSAVKFQFMYNQFSPDQSYNASFT